MHAEVNVKVTINENGTWGQMTVGGTGVNKERLVLEVANVDSATEFVNHMVSQFKRALERCALERACVVLGGKDYMEETNGNG